MNFADPLKLGGIRRCNRVRQLYWKKRKTLQTGVIEIVRENVIPHRKLIHFRTDSKTFCFKGWISPRNDERGERPGCFQVRDSHCPP